ncbi:MAG: hypothetical protein AB1483_09820 [Candidatus Zixiibacteriota bacterium]
MSRLRRCLEYSKIVIVGLVVVVLLIPLTAPAQEVAVGQATATVQAVLAVTSVQDLNFGNVLQGVPSSADIDVVAEAADFSVTGSGGAEVALYLQLPEYLWNSTNTDRMIISFSSTDCEIDANIGTAATKVAPVVADPYALPATNLHATDNILHVYLAGSVFPAVDQAVGSYTADIVLTAAYTGN